MSNFNQNQGSQNKQPNQGTKVDSQQKNKTRDLGSKSPNSQNPEKSGERSSEGMDSRKKQAS